MFGFKVYNSIILRCRELLIYLEAIHPKIFLYFIRIKNWYHGDKLEEFEIYLLETLKEELRKQKIKLIIEKEHDMVIYKFIYK